jgi:hypothetical protein
VAKSQVSDDAVLRFAVDGGGYGGDFYTVSLSSLGFTKMPSVSLAASQRWVLQKCHQGHLQPQGLVVFFQNPIDNSNNLGYGDRDPLINHVLQLR